MLPISDGKKTLNILANIQKVLKSSGREITLSIQKGLSLAVIDDAWKEHLREMDDLKQSVQNASYEQKDPLLIYKFEAFELFKTLMVNINKDVSTFLSLGSLPVQGGVREGRREQTDMSRMQAGRDNSLGSLEDPSARPGQQLQTNAGNAPEKPQPVHVEKKVGRNDPCPCGSGKKYKNCHGA
jgi:preprotein translocase subunit SecA